VGDAATGGPAHPAHWLAIAEQVLGYAEAEGAGQAEALVTAEDSALTRFANNEIHQNVAESNARVNLRFVMGKRIGVASTGRLDESSLRRLAETAGRIARHVEELDDFVSLPEPGDIPDLPEAFSDGTTGATPELRAEGARTVIGAADAAGVTAFGSFTTTVESIAVASSLGIRAAQARTSSQLLTVAMGPDSGSGYAEACAIDATTIDAAALGREVVERARLAQDPVAIEPGDYPVVLDEYAVVDIIDMLGYVGFSALAVQEGRSFVEPGKRVGSDLVSIWDDGLDPAGLPMAFDYEGVAKQRVPLIESGICRGVVYDTQTAAREGRHSTGHGLPAPNPWGPYPLNQFMAPGTAGREELIGGLDRGLLVTRFWYTNPVHPKLAIITGMTRDGTFLIENGKIVSGVKNFRFHDSPLRCFAKVNAATAPMEAITMERGKMLLPAVRLPDFNFSSSTKF
jgi:predicted Zn-dependent protease